MDADDQAAIAAVRRYAAALARIRSRLFDDYPEFQGVLDLMKAVRSGPRPRLPREGHACSHLASLGELREVRPGRWYALR